MNINRLKDWNVWTCFVLVVSGAALSMGFRMLFQQIGIMYYEEVERQLLTGKTKVYLVVELILLSPLLEEVFFRGILFRWLRKRTPWILAMVFSAVIFGLYHWNIPQGIYAFVMGLFLAWSLEQYQTMKAPIVIHMAANMMALMLVI